MKRIPLLLALSALSAAFSSCTVETVDTFSVFHCYENVRVKNGSHLAPKEEGYSDNGAVDVRHIVVYR